MMEHNYDNCHNITCRRKCNKDGYKQALEDVTQYIKEEKNKLGSHLQSEEFMCGWDYLTDAINKFYKEIN